MGVVMNTKRVQISTTLPYLAVIPLIILGILSILASGGGSGGGGGGGGGVSPSGFIDDFSAAMIDRTKWADLEFVRRVNNGVLESTLTRFGSGGFNNLNMVDSPGTGLNGPVGVAFGPDGNLYVASFAGDEVKRYDGTTGAFIDTFVTVGSGGLDAPRLMFFGTGLLVASGLGDAVPRYDAITGAFLGDFVPAGSGGLDSPRGLAIGPDGNLYVVAGGTADAVLRYNGGTGAFIDAFVTGLINPFGLVFGPDGNLYVSEIDSAEVLRFNGTSGVFIDTFVPAGSGGLGFPRDLLFGPDGNLYVSSAGSDEVLR
jgi:DNA-binding beta-propeller fold protein YncE